MILSSKTLENLTEMINEKTAYRSGPKLVELFNGLGFHDSYGPGFPSRGYYTKERLAKINGTPELDKCIKLIFAPINFIRETEKLANCLKEFNEYLAFDNWMIEVKNRDIEIHKTTGPNIEEVLKNVIHKDLGESEESFLRKEFAEIQINDIPILETVKPVLSDRVKELYFCLDAKAYLSAIILAGSILEGVLLGIALNNPKEYNQSHAAPKERDGKTRPLHDWTLSNLIDVSFELQLIKEDVKKFSHVLRDFRNYIHPYQQMSSRFYPDEHTTKICLQVLKAAICQVIKSAK